ncbi:hypothetical protein CSV79_14475 [Sporosarcina sp. P13]|uniref:TIGR03826 family flagellar region protein n=1 Tax=Sporosarcina sp. P13 TaxID=2048263 RepID=UPI000C16E122|nr:TIGR03826 family flagellar region protein [Sporosarcina sp. P13]PIC62960.1 hypothetical protein CSV79_14475 [Sporosarcina sp. P13]
MAEIRICPTCGNIFSFTGFRDICTTCTADEEKKYEEVYHFLRKRENRAANIERIVEVTGVTESLLHEWVRKGRLQTTIFPNLGYPCDKCGALTTTGKLCDTCTEEIKHELNMHDAAMELREALAAAERGAYYTQKKSK